MTLLRNFGWVGALSLVGVGISFASQLVFSYYFGTTMALDAYWVAFAIMNFLAFPLISLREALVSEIHERSNIDMQNVSAYFSKVLSLILIMALIGSSVGLIFSNTFIDLIAGDQNPLLHAEVLQKLLWLAPALILLALADTFNALLTSYNRTILQMASRVLGASSTVVIIALAANWIGSQALVLGFVLGQALNVIALAWILYRQGLSFRPTLPIGMGSDFVKLNGALCCSYGINQVYAIYEKSIFLKFGVGLVSAFQYSVSVTNIIVTVLGLSLANLLWPRFLNHVSNKNTQNFYAEGALSSKLLLLVLGWVCALIFIHANWVVQTVFARGTFAQEAVSLTTLCLQMTIFAAIPISINFVLGRAMISARASKSIMLIGFSTAITGIVVLWIANYLNEARLAMGFWFLANLMGCVLSGLLFMRKTQAGMSTYQSSLFWILRYGFGLIIAMSLSFEFVVPYVFSGYSLIDVVCKSLVFTLLYGSLVFLLGLLKGIPIRSLIGRAQ
jgi:putative peptidoglycan lipid II flippase